MAKFSVCRIYKVTLWLNFSYNYSVNLLQILHLYIHPKQVCKATESENFQENNPCNTKGPRNGHGKKEILFLSKIRMICSLALYR